MEGKATSALQPQARPGKCLPQDCPCSPWLEISATTEVCQDGLVVPLHGLGGAAGACGHDLPIYHNLREKHGDLGNNSNLAAFFKEALARWDTHKREEKEKKDS